MNQIIQAAEAIIAQVESIEAGPLDRVRATDCEEMARLREDNFVLRARMHAIALLSSEVSP